MRATRQAILISILLTAPALAGQAVHFTDGRVLKVEAVDLVEDNAFLTLPGGGRIAVPADRIESWVELAGPAPPARPVSVVVVDEPWRDAAGQYAELIAASAERHGLDPALLTAVAQVESAFNPNAVSPKGASGLLQLMPATAKRFGVEDVFDPSQNLDGGAEYLSWLLDRFEGETELALAGYNAGEGAVAKHNGVPPYRETRRYVASVLQGAVRLAP